MAKVLIPTPLRQYADKHDTVELGGTTVGEVLGKLTTEYQDLRRQLYSDEGKLRSFVNVYINDEDIRYLKKEATPVKEGDTISIVPEHRGRCAGGGSAGASGHAFERGNPALQPAPDHAGSRHGGPAQAEERQGAHDRRGRPGRAAGHVSGGGGSRAHRHRGFRRGRFHQPAAAGDPWHERRGPQEARFGRRHHARDQSVCADRQARGGALERKRARLCSRTTTSSWTAPTIFRRATW